MGLLDDAIREHLELKRLRGADPGDVARHEREVLGLADAESGDRNDEEPSEHGDLGVAPPSVRSTHAGQQTVELDMDEVLEGGDEHAAHPLDKREATAPSQSRPARALDQEDSLEWEMPAEQEHADDVDESDEEVVEDVLEETPDFLRDTPEQERLWFEQRPPRDFDFNE